MAGPCELWVSLETNNLKYYIQRIVGKPRGQQLKVIYPKCNKQEDSWECGYYVMSWIRTIIRAAIKDEWIERFKNPSPLPDDIIHTLRQEWATYLLER
ncbi:hypothetical protein DEO72_LG4g1065 [Vigna unguiculata]|uniref:Ulp1 protease family n=1 Tax=Vigna unguiculata TaxID=3917 RepID=A0A4D6LNL6_VIGUN|nr:hypothetical protein DEO72_LG4g1065 [Vigna unguiculata]